MVLFHNTLKKTASDIISELFRSCGAKSKGIRNMALSEQLNGTVKELDSERPKL